MSSPDQNETAEVKKKEYTKPELIVYGTITDLTRNETDMNLMMDNPTMKT